MKILILACLVLMTLSLKAQGLDDIKKCQQDSIGGRKVHEIVEEPPQYYGGFQKFYREISSRIEMRDVKGGPIIFSFVVDIDGSIKNFCPSGNIIVPAGLVEHLGKWSPGLIRGKKVPVRMTISIHIKLG